MPLFNGDVIFIDSSGQLRALDGPLYLKSDNNDVVIKSGSNLHPESSAGLQNLGNGGSGWNTIYGTTVIADVVRTSLSLATTPGSFAQLSGFTIINGTLVTSPTAFSPSSSGATRIGSNNVVGGEDTWVPYAAVAANSGVFRTLRPLPSQGEVINVQANLLPTTNRPGGLGLGSNARRWFQIFGGSGNFSSDITSSFGDITTQFGDIVASFGSVSAGQNVTAGNDVTANSDITAGGDVSATGDLSAGNGLLVQGDANFPLNNATHRPKVKGSGVALTNEIVHYERAQGNNLASNRTFLPLSQHNLGTIGFPPPLMENSKLYPKFVVNALHASSAQTGQPSGWYLGVRKRRANNTTIDVGSGIFWWSPTNFVSHTTVNELELNPTEAEFNAGDMIELYVHNDGSGTAINGVVTLIQIGFQNNVAVSGAEI